MKTFEIMLSLEERDVEPVVNALFRAGYAVYKPSTLEDGVNVSFCAFESQIHENKPIKFV